MAKADRESVRAGLDDILANVVRGDRERSGRAPHTPPPAPVPDPAPTEEPAADPDPVLPPVDNNYDNNTSHSTDGHYDNNTITQTKKRVVSRRPSAAQRGATPGTPSPRSKSLLTTRREEAQELAATPTTTVTLRIPQGLNEWLDEYVHRSWPTRVRKQELVVEALQLLIARRGHPGEAVLPTELLDGDGADEAGG